MKKFSKKYRKHFGRLFLSIYAVFVLVGIFHYHPYNFDQESSFSYSAPTNRASDLTFDDFFSICSLHQFSQTIDNIHYSSSDIIQSLSVVESNLFQVKINNILNEAFSKTSPRAPPLFIS